MTVIITGRRPAVQRKEFQIVVGMESTRFSDVGIRRQYGVPLDATCTPTPLKSTDQTQYDYEWFEVTL